MLEQEEMTEDARRYLALIRERALVMKQMTEDMFRYSVVLCGSSGSSPKQSLQNEETDVTALLEESIAGFYTSFRERNIVPSITFPAEPVRRVLDRKAVLRVFGNILQNSARYSGGDLDIRMTEKGEIFFSNTAPALDAVQTGKLFDRFFSVESARQTANSAGLGLSIAKALMEQMQGDIFARYEEGRLTICVRLRTGRTWCEKFSFHFRSGCAIIYAEKRRRHRSFGISIEISLSGVVYENRLTPFLMAGIRRNPMQLRKFQGRVRS